MLAHDVNERKCRAKVVRIVLYGLFHGFAHSLEARKVNDTINGMLVENTFQCVSIADVCLIESKALGSFFPYDLGDAIENLDRSVRQVVHNYDIISLFEQLNNCVAANKSGTPGYKHACLLGEFFLAHGASVNTFAVRKLR